MPEYATIQQHQPLRVPASFDRQGKALVLQLDEVFDDIYRRFGRLRLADMGKEFRKQIADDEGNIADLQFDLAGLTTRVTNAEGNIGSLQVTATALTGRMETAEGNIGALQLTATALTGRIETAEGNITTITADVSGLTTRVSTAEGDIGALEVRAGQIELSVTTKYTIVSGIAIDTNGIDITGNKYVKIRSGGTFDVDSTNFVISSTDKVMRIGNWVLNESGLEYINSSNVSEFKIAKSASVGTFDFASSGLYYSEYLDGSYTSYRTHLVVKFGNDLSPIISGMTIVSTKYSDNTVAVSLLLATNYASVNSSLIEYRLDGFHTIQVNNIEPRTNNSSFKLKVKYYDPLFDADPDKYSIVYDVITYDGDKRLRMRCPAGDIDIYASRIFGDIYSDNISGDSNTVEIYPLKSVTTCLKINRILEYDYALLSYIDVLEIEGYANDAGGGVLKLRGNADTATRLSKRPTYGELSGRA